MSVQVKVERGLVWLIREPQKPSDKPWVLSFKPDTADSIAHQLAVAAVLARNVAANRLANPDTDPKCDAFRYGDRCQACIDDGGAVKLPPRRS